MGACFLFPDHRRAKLRSPDAFWWYNPSDEAHTLDRVEPIDHNTDNNRTKVKIQQVPWQASGWSPCVCLRQTRKAIAGGYCNIQTVHSGFKTKHPNAQPGNARVCGLIGIV
jgi:hypothetical protein